MDSNFRQKKIIVKQKSWKILKNPEQFWKVLIIIKSGKKVKNPEKSWKILKNPEKSRTILEFLNNPEMSPW